MGLSDIVKAHKATKAKKSGGVDPSGGILIPAIRRHFDDRPVRPDDGYLHSSQAKDYCPRMAIIAEAFEVHLPVFKPGLQLSVTFDIGHAVHSRLQNEILGTAGVIIGQWECLRCGSIAGGQIPSNWLPRPDICGGCGTSEFRFKESRAVDKKYLLIGSLDGGLKLPTGEIIGLEIKTVSKAVFDGLAGALSEHILQANIYLSLFGLHRQLFLYVSKGWHGLGERVMRSGEGIKCGPLFETMMEANPLVINTLRAQREQEFAARNAWQAGHEAYPDPLPVCNQKTASRVKSCPCAELCWDLR